MGKRILKGIGLLFAVGVLLTFGLSWERYDTINLDTSSMSGFWQYKICGIPFWTGRSFDLSPGYSSQYEAIFGHPANAASARACGVGVTCSPTVILPRCRSFGMPFSERKALLDGLYLRYRHGLIDAAASREIFSRIDTAIPLTRDWVDFIDHRLDRSAPLTEAIRRDLGVPSRYPGWAMPDTP